VVSAAGGTSAARKFHGGVEAGGSGLGASPVHAAKLERRVLWQQWTTALGDDDDGNAAAPAEIKKIAKCWGRGRGRRIVI